MISWRRNKIYAGKSSEGREIWGMVAEGIKVLRQDTKTDSTQARGLGVSVPKDLEVKVFKGNGIRARGGRFQERQGGWRHSDQRPGQAPEKDPGRERAIVISEGNKANSNPDIKCFRCLGSGHFQADCTKEPICYKCKEKGHLAIDCKSESKKL